MADSEDEFYSEEVKEKTDEDDDPSEESAREELTEEDELYPEEEGFLEGQTGDEETAACEQCGKVLSDDADEVLELQIGEQKHFFDSEKCAIAFKKKHKPK